MPAITSDLYYVTHFRYVLSEIETRHAALLAPKERVHLHALAGLSEPALCLYARLANRRGPCFRWDRLYYPEITGIEAALVELVENSLVEYCTVTGRLREPLLATFTHTELAASLSSDTPRFTKKSLLLDWLAEWNGRNEWLVSLLKQYPVIRLNADDPMPYLRFLFFGELRDNLSDFVIRELGHIVTESVDPEKMTSRFATQKEARDTYRMACLYAEFRRRRDEVDAPQLFEWWQSQSPSREALASQAHPCFDRLIDRLGRRLERQGETKKAVALYHTSPVAPNRERLARLWLKQGETKAAMALLEAMCHSPEDPAEAYAARQLIARQLGHRISEARHYQSKSLLLQLDYETGNVESAVLDHYRAAGWEGVHAENWPWNGLFGLLLWDIAYDPSHGGFHSTLQPWSSDLDGPAFYRSRKQAIETRLELLQQHHVALQHIRVVHDEKNGLYNPFIYWNPALLPVLEKLLQGVEGACLKALLRRMCQLPAKHRKGFPDLMLWKDSKCRFIEVKSENDQLAPHQYEWLRFMGEQGIDVSLVKVRRPVLRELASA